MAAMPRAATVPDAAAAMPSSAAPAADARSFDAPSARPRTRPASSTATANARSSCSSRPTIVFNRVLGPSRCARGACARRAAAGASGGSGRDRLDRSLKQRIVDPFEQGRQLAFVWRAQHQHPRSFVRRKTAIVEVVAIQGHEGPSKLLREAIVLHVGGAPQVVFFEDEQDIPLEPL